MNLFPNNLIPSRDHLARKVRKEIRNQSLQTSDLMLLRHLCQIRLHEDFFEWGSSVAHSRRNHGSIWKDAVNIWATHLYFAKHKAKTLSLKRLLGSTILALSFGSTEGMWKLFLSMRAAP